MSEQNKAESSAQSPSQTTPGAMAVGPAQPEPTKTNWKLLLAIIAGVIVFAVILAGIILLAFTYPAGTAVVRDLFIIAMAFTSFLIGILMLVLIFQLQALIALLRNEIKPMLTNANQTVNTVRGTAVFVSDNLVKPTIGFASFIAGVRGMQQALVGRMNTAGKRPGASASSQSQASNQP